MTTNNMTTPLFTPNGDGYDITMPGLILILADTVYGDGRKDSTPAGIMRATEMLAAIFKAARDGGFTQGDVLMTLLHRGEVSHRVKAMAVQACNAAGNDRLAVILASMRKGK